MAKKRNNWPNKPAASKSKSEVKYGFRILGISGGKVIEDEVVEEQEEAKPYVRPFVGNVVIHPSYVAEKANNCYRHEDDPSLVMAGGYVAVAPRIPGFCLVAMDDPMGMFTVECHRYTMAEGEESLEVLHEAIKSLSRQQSHKSIYDIGWGQWKMITQS